MLYTCTTIRINNETGRFENTETHRIMLRGDLENELIRNGCSDKQLTEFHEMPVGSKTFETTRENGLMKGTRFMYVHRIV